MNFVLYMVCIAVAVFMGALLDRYVVVSKRMSELDDEEYEYHSIAYSSKEEADEVISLLKKRFKWYGILRMYDLYILSNLRADPEDIKYGWKKFPEMKIEKENEKWVLTPSEPEFLLEK